MGNALYNIPPAVKGKPIWPARIWNIIVAAMRKALNLTGPNVRVTSTGIHIGDSPRVSRKAWNGMVYQAIVLLPNQWIYLVRSAIKATPGYGGWAWEEEFREVVCFNRYEDINSSSGVQGTGVNLDNLPGTFAHQPIPIGTPVEVTEERVQSTGEIEYWFAPMNGIDGQCSGSGGLLPSA